MTAPTKTAPTKTAPKRTLESPLTESELHSVLERARAVGFLGPGPLSVHVDHARQYADAIASTGSSVLDIGSGGGIPGLPMAILRPDLLLTLLDAAQRRTAFLLWAVTELGLSDRVSVVTGRAERLAQTEAYRHRYDVVVSRGFGPPATTLECAAGFVRAGGRVLISEPPERRLWPSEPLEQLGLRWLGSESLAEFEAVQRAPAEYPRSSKRMQNTPLFDLR